EADRPLIGTIDGVHHVHRQAALVEHIGDTDVLDLNGPRLQRARGHDDVPFFLEDPVRRSGGWAPRISTRTATPAPSRKPSISAVLMLATRPTAPCHTSL